MGLLTRRLAILIPGLSLLPKMAKADPANRSKNFLNGRFWNGVLEQERPFFVLGLSEGLTWSIVLGAKILDDGATRELGGVVGSVIPTISPAEISKALTSYYDDPTNLAIPITAMLSVVAQKLSGSSPDNLERVLSTFRAWYKN